MLLTEQLEAMAQGDDAVRTTPALVFCFNREECWTVAEQLKGKRVLSDGQQKRLAAELEKYDWSEGAGPKLKQLLDARRRRASCRRAAQVPPHRRRAFPAEAALRGHLHRDAFGGHQPAGPVGRRAEHHERPAGQEEAARSQHGAPDFRPGGPAAVRQGRARLRAGPRGRREDRPLAREVRPDPRGHERPRA